MKIKPPPALVVPLAYGLVQAMLATIKFTEEGRDKVDLLTDNHEPVVFALWHDELFPLICVKRDLKLIAVISQSKDGEYLARFIQMFGARVARGSSSRGGVKALLQVSKAMQHERISSALTVDGPKGPRHKAKEGAVFIAARAKAKIVPLRVRMSNSYKFERAWDKFQLPLPFSRVHAIFGEPYSLPDETIDAAFLARETLALEERLNALL